MSSPETDPADRLDPDPSEDPGAGAAGRLLRPVVLVGLMGAGKTTVGRRLAAALDAGFVDSDEEIESAARMTVAEIFAEMGEEEFRQGERRVIARLMEGPPRIIATGGGAFMNAETRAAIAAAASRSGSGRSWIRCWSASAARTRGRCSPGATPARSSRG